MTIRIERLTAADFDETMALLGHAFAEQGVSDFATLLPALYQRTDEHQGHHIALRDGGQLVALLGIFPIEWSVGDEVLRVAGIGGVSVTPQHRGRGHMSTLMKHAANEIANEGYALSYLAGLRQRYRHFGWEVGGTRLHLELSPKNVAQLALRSDTHSPALTLTPLRGSDVSTLQQYHDQQLIHCVRRGFAQHLHNWRHTPLVARDTAGLAGYLVAYDKAGRIVELAGRDVEAETRIVQRYVQRRAQTCSLTLPALRTPLSDKLLPIAETAVLKHSGNWWIRDWQRVLNALLKLRHQVTPLPPGSVVLNCESQMVRLWVDSSGAGAEQHPGPAALDGDGASMTRLLFGPLPPHFTADLPPAATPLHQWCPLPLAMPWQDQV